MNSFRELTPEREEQILNGIVRRILRFGLESPAILFMESIKPIGVFGTKLFLLPSAPILEAFGVRAHDYASLFMKRDSMERLIRKIEEDIASEDARK